MDTGNGVHPQHRPMGVLQAERIFGDPPPLVKGGQGRDDFYDTSLGEPFDSGMMALLKAGEKINTPNSSKDYSPKTWYGDYRDMCIACNLWMAISAIQFLAIIALLYMLIRKQS